MWRKLSVIILLLILTVLCAVWAPWQSWNISLATILGITTPPKFARLQVSSLAGEIEIFVDGETKGTVGPDGSPLAIEDIAQGQRLIKITRKSSINEAYITFERLLQFSEDIDTVIAYELGPTKEFSEGHIITAYKSVVNGDQTKLNIETDPDNVKISLDGNDIGRTPLNGILLDVGSAHRLKFEKQGYESLEINLLPEDPAEREKLKGYDINVEANLLLLPLQVNR